MKKILFQLHWFIGITVGTILMVVGLSGATLSFREELLDLLNPGVMTLATNPGTPLTPEQLIERLYVSSPSLRIAQLTVYADPRTAARVNFAPEPGAKRGEMRYVNPATGTLLPALRGNDFFQFVERFHRWFLTSQNMGRVLTGCTALCMLVMALSGLYLRWPKQPLDWRNWFKVNFSLSGRAFLWNLHLVLGTWALVMYLVLSLTGLYWAFDWFKDGTNWIVGEQSQTRSEGARKVANAESADGRRPKRDGAAKTSHDDAGSPTDLTLTWQAFLQETATTGGYSTARLRLPEKTGKPIQINYLDAKPPHERARNQMLVQPQTGAISQRERYADKSAGGQLVSSIYVLHLGSYFGLPGRILMTLAGLGLPLFGITGWLLYLERRRRAASKKQRAIARMTQAT
ncbi:PepSY-associated TM helix domain-containing protein [Glaciimonas sp. GG7]